MSIEVLNESGAQLDVVGLSRLARFVMDEMRVHPQAELCLKLVDEATIAELNEQWMGKTGPTDVLAFPMDELRPGLVNEELEEGILGDLVLCVSVAARQAEEAGHPTGDEIALLTVHGVLHLLGYDHAEPEEHREMFDLQARLLAGWHEGASVSLVDVWLLVLAAVLVLVAGLFSSADAALSSFSKARAEEIAADGTPGADRLLVIVGDPARYLNTALLLRMLNEIAAIILVTVVTLDLFVARGGSESGPQIVSGRWVAMLVSLAVMLVVSFVVIGVAPRTLGRQHSERVALHSSGPLLLATKVLGPLPRLLIVVGNAITPGRGFSEGPFATEAELRELVDLAEASSVIESGERQMIHSVFELGNTLARGVMVPRTDVVFIERGKTLRQAMSLALRSGYSRIPVVGDNLDDIIGFAYLKDLTKRVFDRHEAETTERVETVMRPVLFVPDSKPVDALLREMQAERKHVAVVVDEYGGTAGLVTIEDVLEEIVGEITDEYDVARVDIEQLADGRARVSSRYPVGDLQEVLGIPVEDDDVDTVGGLMAKHLGRVPIAGSVVEVHGMRFQAETPAGRRNRIGAVVVSLVDPAPESDSAEQSAESYSEHHAG